MSIVDEFRAELEAFKTVKGSVLAFVEQTAAKLDAALADDLEVAEQRAALEELREGFTTEREALVAAVLSGTPAEAEGEDETPTPDAPDA